MIAGTRGQVFARPFGGIYMYVSAASIQKPVRHRRDRGQLGSCPGCGKDVPANASALLYGGGFYHVVCALWHRECGRALAGAR